MGHPSARLDARLTGNDVTKAKRLVTARGELNDRAIRLISVDTVNSPLGSVSLRDEMDHAPIATFVLDPVS